MIHNFIGKTSLSKIILLSTGKSLNICMTLFPDVIIALVAYQFNLKPLKEDHSFVIEFQLRLGIPGYTYIRPWSNLNALSFASGNKS